MPVTPCKAGQGGTGLTSLSKDLRGWWCLGHLSERSLLVRAVLLWLWACCLVSVPLFFIKKEPLTPTGYIPLLCRLAEDCKSIGCSLPSQGAFVSQNLVILASLHWNVNAKPACVPAVSPVCLSRADEISPVALHWGAVCFLQCADNFILYFQLCYFQYYLPSLASNCSCLPLHFFSTESL